MFLPTPCQCITQSSKHTTSLLPPPSYGAFCLFVTTPDSGPHLVSSGVPSAATVVIVMCIAALVVVVVLGIYRIHLTHQQEVKLADTTKEEDVTWGDSALTITVNPMEVRG